MNKALKDLIRISNSVGKNKLLTQGGGGNTSVKTEDDRYMYIKASGTALKDMDSHTGWRRLRLEAVLELLNDKSLVKLSAAERENRIVEALNRGCEDNIKTGARPSVESHLHAMLARCVIHLHPVAVGAYVCAGNGRAEIEKLFKDEDSPPMWVPYTDPGYTLAKRVAGLSVAYNGQYRRLPAIIFLENHGLLVSADSADKALKIVATVVAACSRRFKKSGFKKKLLTGAAEVRAAKFAIRRAYLEATGKYVSVRHFSDELIADFLIRKDAKELASLPPLTPDELVYANGSAVWVDRCDYKAVLDKLRTPVSSGQRPAAAFLVRGLGLFVAGGDKTIPVIKDIITSSLMVRRSAVNFGGVKSLNRPQRDFISRWEAESFRQKLARSSGRGELFDRIALVTGAGSGLGRNIAIGLARAGAMVALADIDKSSAEETYRLIRAELSDSGSMVLPCDVTNEKNVDEAFSRLIERWGGLDILVNAAGIAPAYPLIELPVEKLRMAIEINLTGYFLMARAAAVIMVQQGMGGSIINISSKSGLEASKNNTPYNVTKAGEIHMARGWALELGQYGIRVNSVAPGNVFEGSKIWNPEYIRVCAKKYGLRPEEVIPYYISKTALRREITGQDIADSVCFLCSDKARTITGQTLVADGGQVMVR